MPGCAFAFRRVTPGLQVVPLLWLTAPAPASAVPLIFSASAAGSDAVVSALLGLNLLLAGSIVVFLAAGLATRWARAHMRARRARFAAAWEPVLHGRIAGDTDPLPPLARRDQLLFLLLLLHLAGYVRDEGEAGLRACGIEIGLEPRVLALLTSRVPWQRLLAARAAGLLRLTRAEVKLTRMAAGAESKLALAATEALLTIAPAAGHAAFRALVLRGGWPAGAMVKTSAANPAATSQALEDALAQAPSGSATPLIRLLELIEDLNAAPALRRRLAGNRDNAETAALLHALGRFGAAEDRATALAFIADPRWVVRMQAAFALGLLGQAVDLDTLARMLGDPEWWVRYRAAQALLRLAQGDRSRLAATMDKVNDRFARDAMVFALAEFEWEPSR